MAFDVYLKFLMDSYLDEVENQKSPYKSTLGESYNNHYSYISFADEAKEIKAGTICYIISMFIAAIPIIEVIGESGTSSSDDMSLQGELPEYGGDYLD